VACSGVNITFTLPYLYLYSGSGLQPKSLKSVQLLAVSQGSLFRWKRNRT